MQNSFDEISVEEKPLSEDRYGKVTRLKYLPNWPAVNIEFQDLVYTIPDIGGEFVIANKKIIIMLPD